MFARITLRAPRRPRRVFSLLATPLVAGLGACDFPTELPKWDTIWVVPGEATTIAVSRLLPGSVQVVPGGTAFVLSLPSVNFSRTLGEICSACSAAQGLTVPKPAFTATLVDSIALPANVLSARLTGGEIGLRLSHTFSFDPIRPSATARGYVVVTVTSSTATGSVTLARDSIAGETTAFAPGTTLARTLSLATATINRPVTITVRVFSPAGDPVTINTSQGFSVTATPTQVQISEAQVRVANQSVSAQQVQLDLDIDRGIADRVKGGALLLDMQNPFSVSGTLTLTFSTPNAVVRKQVQLQPGSNTTRVPFNEPEIRSILRDKPVQFAATGNLSAPASGTAVRPSQVVTIRSRLEVTFGPDED